MYEIGDVVALKNHLGYSADVTGQVVVLSTMGIPNEKGTIFQRNVLGIFVTDEKHVDTVPALTSLPIGKGRLLTIQPKHIIAKLFWMEVPGRVRQCTILPDGSLRLGK